MKPNSTYVFVALRIQYYSQNSIGHPSSYHPYAAMRMEISNRYVVYMYRPCGYSRVQWPVNNTTYKM
jgi:hypothetical protein